MHSDTNTQATHKLHRFLIAAPLFVLCFCVSVVLPLRHSAGNVTAPLFDLREGSGSLITDTIAAEGDAILSHSGTLSLMRGSAIIASRTMFSVQSGPFTVSSWNGAIEVSQENQAVTVVALTAPALIRYDGHVWLVPVGMQKRVDATSASIADDAVSWIEDRAALPLPAYYLTSRIATADRLLDMTELPAVVEADWFSPALGQALRFDTARERAEDRQAVQHLTNLNNALVLGDAEAVHTALNNVNVQSALASDAGAVFMPDLLAAAVAAGDERMLLSFFNADADLQLIGRFHPAVRSYVGVLPWEQATDEERLTWLIQLPGAIRDEHPLPPAAVQQWGDQWHAYLQESASGVAVTALNRLEKDIQNLQKDDLPERARLFAAATSDAFSLNLADAPALDRLENLADGGRIVLDPVALPVMEMNNVQVAVDPQQEPLHPQRAMEMEASVRASVAEMGAMFTSKSAFTAQTSSLVQVSDVVFPTQSGDRLLSFVYNVDSGMVVDIRKNGRVLPYGLPLAQYVEWASH